jgi:hypothetical protein
LGFPASSPPPKSMAADELECSRPSRLLKKLSGRSVTKSVTRRVENDDDQLTRSVFQNPQESRPSSRDPIVAGIHLCDADKDYSGICLVSSTRYPFYSASKAVTPVHSLDTPHSTWPPVA